MKRTEWIPRATLQAARQVAGGSDEATKQMSRPVVISRQGVSSRRRRMQTLWSTVYMAAGTGVVLMLTKWAVLSVMSLWVLKQLV